MVTYTNCFISTMTISPSLHPPTLSFHHTLLSSEFYRGYAEEEEKEEEGEEEEEEEKEEISV